MKGAKLFIQVNFETFERNTAKQNLLMDWFGKRIYCLLSTAYSLMTSSCFQHLSLQSHMPTLDTELKVKNNAGCIIFFRWHSLPICFLCISKSRTESSQAEFNFLPLSQKQNKTKKQKSTMVLNFVFAKEKHL